MLRKEREQRRPADTHALQVIGHPEVAQQRRRARLVGCAHHGERDRKAEGRLVRAARQRGSDAQRETHHPIVVDDLAGPVQRFEHAVRSAGTSAILSVVVSDGDSLIGVRSAVATGNAPSLYYRFRAAGVAFASEPLDDAADWTPLVVGRLVVASRSGIEEERVL